jgi:O-acetyl-ADP-ribose deacetylase (regulator of RNase III)
MIQHKVGNILDCTEDIVVQSVNHKGVMGSGLAKQIRDRWVGIINEDEAYKSICRDFAFKDIKETGLVAWFFAQDKIIANVFGQEDYGKDKGRRYTQYKSLKNGLRSVLVMANSKGLSVAIPHGIGCGLGGGDWNHVLAMINELSDLYPKVEVSIYKYEQ